MKGSGASRRGRPLVVFGALMAGWIAMRAILWESPFPVPLPSIEFADSQNAAPSALGAGAGEVVNGLLEKQARFPTIASAVPTIASTVSTVAATSPPLHMVPSRHTTMVSDPGIIAAHQLMWLAAMARLPVPENAEPASEKTGVREARSAGFGAVLAPARGKRWLFDIWALHRPGSDFPATPSGPRPASYGGSQAGAVLRYRLLPESNRYRPTAFLRATKAFSADREVEVAAGLSVRPAQRVPVSAQAELRAVCSNGRTRLRPAAILVSELPPQNLPAGLRGETYVQAGYVGGDFATGFLDGQARITRSVARSGLGELRAGGGVWGGAQKGAARLDFGPTAGIDLKVGEVPARLAVDYRYRVAGDAAPGSGFALTLSTGF